MMRFGENIDGDGRTRASLIRRLAWLDQHVPVSRLFPNVRDAILMYHSVSPPEEPGYWGGVTVDRFRKDLTYLTEEFEVVDLPTIVDHDTRQKRVVLTFDDGYVNFYTHVLPLLREFDVPATLFVTAGFINDRNRDLICDRLDVPSNPDRIMLTESHLHEIADGDLVTVGNHTLTHPNLMDADGETIRREVLDGKSTLERITGSSIDRFCFPYNDYDDRAAAIVEDSHDFSVGPLGLVSDDPDSHFLPRIPAQESPALVRWRMTDLSGYVDTTLNRIGDVIGANAGGPS